MYTNIIFLEKSFPDTTGDKIALCFWIIIALFGLFVLYLRFLKWKEQRWPPTFKIARLPIGTTLIVLDIKDGKPLVQWCINYIEEMDTKKKYPLKAFYLAGNGIEDLEKKHTYIVMEYDPEGTKVLQEFNSPISVLQTG